MKYLIKLTIKDKAWEIGATETEIEAKAYASGYCSAIINHTSDDMDDKAKQEIANQFSIVRIGDENKEVKSTGAKKKTLKGNKNGKSNKRK